MSWTTAAQDEGKRRKTAEQGAERFVAKWTAAEKARAGLRHAVVCPNPNTAATRGGLLPPRGNLKQCSQALSPHIQYWYVRFRLSMVFAALIQGMRTHTSVISIDQRPAPSRNQEGRIPISSVPCRVLDPLSPHQTCGGSPSVDGESTGPPTVAQRPELERED